MKTFYIKSVNLVAFLRYYGIMPIKTEIVEDYVKYIYNKTEEFDQIVENYYADDFFQKYSAILKSCVVQQNNLKREHYKNKKEEINGDNTNE